MNRTIGLISTNYSTPEFGKLTEKRPPATVPFGGLYRLVDFALSNMANAGITTVGIVTPYYYRSIMDHIRAGKAWGLDRKEGGLFILPGTVFGPRLLSGRFLFRDIIHNRILLDRSDGDYVLVSDATTVCNIDYRPLINLHELEGRPITMVYKKMPAGSKRKGLYLSLDETGRITGMEPGEEGENLFLQSFLIDKSWLLRLISDYGAQDHLDFTEILQENLERATMGSYEFTGYTGLIDNLQDYMSVSNDLLRPDVRKELFRGDRPITTKVNDTAPARYVPGSEVVCSIVSAGSIMEGRVENSLISRGVRVEKGASVKNCVLMDDCTVHSGAVLEYVIADKRSEIFSDVVLRGTEDHPCVLARDLVL